MNTSIKQSAVEQLVICSFCKKLAEGFIVGVLFVNGIFMLNEKYFLGGTESSEHGKRITDRINWSGVSQSLVD